ncbi:MAG: DoxX family protein [Burkholderiaceae bacterium]
MKLSPTHGGTLPASAPTDARSRLVAGLQRLVPDDLIALASRFGIGTVFFLSGRTKVDGMLSVNDTALLLFEQDYALPLIPPVLAAHLATYAEHLLPLLLFIGLGTRLGALGLLGMTAVIQTFVYPSAWPTHLSWAAPLLYLAAHGGGRWSLDHALFRR